MTDIICAKYERKLPVGDPAEAHMFRHNDDTWTVCCFYGPMYFWNTENKSWDSCAVHDIYLSSGIIFQKYASKFETALEILNTVETMEQMMLHIDKPKYNL